MLSFCFFWQGQDIVNIHESNCENTDPYRPIQISCDGVSECRSNINSLDVYSLRFKNCQFVYPHTIIRPIGKYKMDSKKYLTNFVHDMTNVCGCLIKAFIGDNPKRAKARDALQHSSFYACEYCFQKAAACNASQNNVAEKKKELENQLRVIDRKLQKAIEENDDAEDIKTLKIMKDSISSSLKETSKKKPHFVWPSDSRNGEPRTKEKILEIVQKIESGVKLSPDEAKGIVGRSPLLTLENFPFVVAIPAEYLHSSCLGVVKRLVMLTLC